LEAIGLSMSDAISLFVSRIAEEQKLPFEAAIPNEITRKAMEELEQGKGRSFDTVEALMIDLESDD
jgi:DNA-damage-inducible protein J